MAEVEYPSNSYKGKKEEEAKREIKQVTKTPVTIKEQSAAKKIWTTFIAEDLSTIGRSIIDDYIIPGIKECVMNVVEMAMYGETGGRRRSGSGRGSKASYDRYYDDRSRRDRNDRNSRDDDREYVRRQRYNDIVFPNRGEAEDVRRELLDTMEKYEVVSVANFYEMVGVSNRDHTDFTYGWYDLGSLRIENVRGGYVINLPKAVPLD